jgi:hypothetical protein
MQKNVDMRFGTWNIRSLYRAGSLMTVLRELSKYKLDVVYQQLRGLILLVIGCHI